MKQSKDQCKKIRNGGKKAKKKEDEGEDGKKVK